MGKQSRKRMENRIHLLKRLAAEDPEGFLVEWNKRIQSWMFAIWSSARNEACFSEEEYNEFLKRFPHTHRILAPLIRYEGMLYVCLDRLVLYHEEELGAEAFAELLQHVKGGVLKGRALFDLVKRASEVLTECDADRDVVKLALDYTKEVLGIECCRALARAAGWELYRLNGTYERKYVSKAS